MEIRKLAAIKQKQNESLTTYYKRFLNLIQVIESRWGLLVPIKVAEDTTNYARNKKKIQKDTRDKFMACMFIDGLDTARYSRCIDDLANQYLKSQDEYPKDRHCKKH